MPTNLPPGYTPPGQKPDREPTNWVGLIGFTILCGTILGVVWMLTR